ncbi:MAG: PAS domain S-box protein [Bacteroidota bacterium]
MMKQFSAQTDLDLLSAFFDNLPIPVWVKDEGHRHILANAAFCDHFAQKKEELIGNDGMPNLSQAKKRRILAAENMVLETGVSDVNTMRMNFPDGKQHKIVITKSLIRLHNKTKYILAVLDDVTEKDSLVKRLKESEKKYKTIFDLAPEGIGINRLPDKILLEANSALVNAFSVPKKKIIGTMGDSLFRMEDLPELESLTPELEATGRIDNVEVMLMTGCGNNPKPHLLSARLIYLSGKKHVIWTIRDVSKLKHAQEVIRDSEILYKTLVNKSPNLILIHIDGKIVFANDALIAMSGLTKQQLTGCGVWELIKDVSMVSRNCSLERIFSDKNHLQKEVEIQASIRSGQIRDFVLSSNMITYKRKDAIMTILTDITETINVEKLLLNKTIETEEIDRKRFAADLHDDLGPILSSIKLHLGLMQKTCSNDKQKENIHICEELLLEAIEKMSIIANNLMPRLIDNHGLEAALKSFCKSISREGMFSADLVSNLGSIRFSMDVEMHLFRIVGELINNTIKHSGGSKASIRLTYSKGLLSLAYMDSGKGYNPEDAMKKPGGRGLSNILHRVNLIEGEIEFSSVKNGTKVHVQKRIKQI